MQEYPEPDTSLVGYARTSTEDQDCSLQLDALRRAGVHPELICVDQKSGRTFKRDGLNQALKLLSPGSTLIFWKLDRLGRDLVEVILTVNKLTERGVKFRSLTEPHVNTEGRNTAMRRMFFNLTAAWGEMESLLIGERTKAGMEAARLRGKKFGRKTFEQLYVETGKVQQYYAYRDQGFNIEEARLKFDPPIPRSVISKYRNIFELPDVGDEQL